MCVTETKDQNLSLHIGSNEKLRPIECFERLRDSKSKHCHLSFAQNQNKTEILTDFDEAKTDFLSSFKIRALQSNSKLFSMWKSKFRFKNTLTMKIGHLLVNTGKIDGAAYWKTSWRIEASNYILLPKYVLIYLLTIHMNLELQVFQIFLQLFKSASYEAEMCQFFSCN